MAGAQGTRRDPNISQQQVRDVKVLIPPRAEQEAISAHIDQACHSLGLMRDRGQLTTDRLREYRSALIPAAVTGQLDIGKHEKKMEELA
jgi:type I restriction enzyme S subunit